MSEHSLRLSAGNQRLSDGHLLGSSLVEIRSLTRANDRVDYNSFVISKTLRPSQKAKPYKRAKYTIHWIELLKLPGVKTPYITLTRLHINATSDREPNGVLKPGKISLPKQGGPPLVEKNRNPDHKSKNPQLKKASLLET